MWEEDSLLPTVSYSFYRFLSFSIRISMP